MYKQRTPFRHEWVCGIFYGRWSAKARSFEEENPMHMIKFEALSLSNANEQQERKHVSEQVFQMIRFSVATMDNKVLRI